MRGRKAASTVALRRPRMLDAIVRRSCDLAAIMKCAAIALALQGATGLVASRLTVKSSALNAATLEVKSRVAQPQLSLQKRSPRDTCRPKNQPAAVQMHQQPC